MMFAILPAVKEDAGERRPLRTRRWRRVLPPKEVARRVAEDGPAAARRFTVTPAPLPVRPGSAEARIGTAESAPDPVVSPVSPARPSSGPAAEDATAGNGVPHAGLPRG